MVENTIAVDEAARALRSFVCGWNVESSLFIYSAGGVGMGGEWFAGVADDGDILRRPPVLEHNRLESSLGFRLRGGDDV